MTDPPTLKERREWERAFVAALTAEAERRMRTGEGSRPGHHTRLAGLANIQLHHEGDTVRVTADVFAPEQDEQCAEQQSVSVPLTLDNWATLPTAGRTLQSPEAAARDVFAMLEIGD